MQIYDDKVFNNPIEKLSAFNKIDFKKALNRIQALSKKYYLLGYIRYEAKEIFLGKEIKTKFPLLYFEVYEDFQKYQPKNFENIFIYTKPRLTYKQYEKDILRIKEQIEQGNTYEVNYTYDYDVITDCDEFALYQNLLREQKTQYNAFIKNDYETILSYSPELFFELCKNKILTKPMKGTVKRGTTLLEDEANKEFLKNDIKNRAENVMIVDLLRNDLSKIAKTGTVKVPKLFEIETHKTLHQMTSEITAELDENTTLYEILKAIFPCGSITGAPKISTMEIIDRAEKGRRNVYCGAIGFLSPEKTVFSVPIRILQKNADKKTYKYRVGGAIVWDSDIKDEWEETVTKTVFLNQTNLNFKIIETIKACAGELVYGKEHFDRMKKSADYFGFKFPAVLRDFIPQNEGMVRILLSKDGDYDVQYKKLKPEKSRIIKLSSFAIESANSFLYHKTSYRPWYEKSFEKIRSGEIYDEIFFNEKDELTEGARTNIVLQLDGKLYTPKLSCGLLNGILREKLIKEKKVFERVLHRNDLKNAQKIFCINSVRGITEVTLMKAESREVVSK